MNFAPPAFRCGGTGDAGLTPLPSKSAKSSLKPKKPTAAQLRVLRNLAAGRPAVAHCRTVSDHGGLTGTIASLYRRGWLAEGEPTEAGRSAAGVSNQALA